MNSNKLKQDKKYTIVNLLIALGVSIIALFSFNYFKPSFEEMFSIVIFFLTLILLKQN
ncbi:MAG: hypothetical protein ABH811_01345 [archaeon]